MRTIESKKLNTKSKGGKMPKILYTEFVGVDVSKEKLDVYETKNKQYFTVENNKEGIRSLFNKIECVSTQLVLIDLTGKLEQTAVKEFALRGYKVHRAEGRKVREFAKSFGQKAKTDKIDAKMLTVYGASMCMQKNLRLYQQDNSEQLKELISRREDLKEMLQKERNRNGRFTDKAAKDSIKETIKVLQKQLTTIEDEIDQRIINDKELNAKAKVIKSVKSIGKKTTMSLLAAMPELGKANRREIAALAGLAPYANESGKTSKKRKTTVGRPLVKQMLFMCALTAIKSYPLMKSFYEKLLANRKPKMVAIVAVMRKLLVILNNCCKQFYLAKSYATA
jgi:transposase